MKMASKYDTNKLFEHYPLCSLVKYLKSEKDLEKEPDLKGLPTFDVYGLTYNDIFDYLCEKTAIRINAENLYSSTNNQISSRTATLFGICYVPAFICGIIAWPDEGEDTNGILALITLILLILPFIIKTFHKQIYIKRNCRRIYNSKIEEYLTSLQSYIGFIEKKEHNNTNINP